MDSGDSAQNELSDAQRPERWLPLLLVATLVAVDVVPARHPPLSLTAAWAVHVGSCLGQAGLVAGWLVFGRSSLVIRFLVSLAAIGALSGVLAQFTAPTTTEMAAVVATYVAALTGVACAARWSGLALTVSGSPPRPLAAMADTAARVRQFSLAGLFSATTCAAILLAGLRLVAFPWAATWTILLEFSGFVLVALAALSLAWRHRYTPWHLLAASLLAIVAGWFRSWLEIYRLPLSLLMSLSQFLVIVLALFALRASGIWLIASGDRDDAGE